jgi:hypothetical protein
MPDSRCRSCGAAVKNLICEYCGSPAADTFDLATQKEALAEYHYILQNQSAEVQVKMLRNGFLPDATDILIDAGVRCIPLIELDNTADDVARAVFWRLKAITTKLKLTTPTARSEQAVAEFEALMHDFNKADRRLNLMLIAVFAVLVLMCVGSVAFVFSWL